MEQAMAVLIEGSVEAAWPELNFRTRCLQLWSL
jgi:hypothetical protein